MSGPSEFVGIADREIEARKRRDEAQAILDSLPAGPADGAPIIADAPVLFFFTLAYGRVHPEDARDLCRQHFGEDRTPLKSTVSRLWMRLDQAGLVLNRVASDAGLCVQAEHASPLRPMSGPVPRLRRDEGPPPPGNSGTRTGSRSDRRDRRSGRRSGM